MDCFDSSPISKRKIQENMSITTISRPHNEISFKTFFTIGGFPGFVLLMYSVVMALISRRRSVEDTAAVDDSALVQIAMAGLAFAVGFHILHRNYYSRYLVFQSPLKWLLIFSLWAGLSALWSVDSVLTIYRAFEHLSYLLLFTAVIGTLYTKLSVEGMIQWVLYYAVFSIIVSNIRRAQLMGVSAFSLDSLLLEQMASTPYFFLALLLPVGWLVKIIVLLISFLSFSNTAYVGMMAGSLALRQGSKWLGRIFAILLIGTAITWFLVGTETLLQNTVFYGKEGVGMEYTSGRDKIFELSLISGLKRPFTGYGFVAGEVAIISQVKEGVIGAHNGFLSALLGTGFPGVIILMVLLFHIYRTANSKCLPQIYRSAFLASVILIFVHTMGNPGLGSRVYGAWIPAVMIFTLISMVEYHYKKKFFEQ